VNFRETEKLIKKDGWFFIESDGSHYHYKHPFKKGKVTIPYHGSKDIKIETMNSILKQAGLK
jgi:predicted RNA binding protein YcfA (HicA-like mRNA interferase family)